MKAIPENNIVFTISYQGDEFNLKTYLNEYYDLWELINHKLNLKEFGYCGGLGRCGTCMVGIAQSRHSPFTNQMACELRIDDNLSNVFVQIIGDNLSKS